MTGRRQILTLTAAVVALGAPSAVAQEGATERVSVDSNEGQADVFVTPGGETPGSFDPSISADGRIVAFGSNAADLVAGDTNGVFDVFVRDRAVGLTERVSLSSAGVQANGISGEADVSADGRFVAFSSLATNLVAGDTNGVGDVFVRDRLAGTTERVSLDAADGQLTSESFDPDISADGRFVAFHSSGLAFVRDRQAGTSTLVSIDTDGNPVGGSSPAISGDGRFVAFQAASRLFVRDRLASRSELVALGNGAALDGDGSVVAFTSGVGVAAVVMVRDRATGVTERIAPGFDPALSADGRFVVFTDVTGQGRPAQSAFIYDRATDTTEVVSLTSAGAPAGGFAPDVNADGRFVAFFSDASNLVPGDTNGVLDVFVRDRAPAASVRDQLLVLRSRIVGFRLPKGTESSFTTKVDTAVRALDRGNTAAACGNLGALASHARAQAGKKLTQAQAAQVVADARRIAGVLGCR